MDEYEAETWKESFCVGVVAVVAAGVDSEREALRGLSRPCCLTAAEIVLVGGVVGVVVMVVFAVDILLNGAESAPPRLRRLPSVDDDVEVFGVEWIPPIAIDEVEEEEEESLRPGALCSEASCI